MESGENSVFLAYRPAAWLKVTGEDAASYLQGQFSQDLRSLASGASAYGLLLNHKGRIQADGFIVKAAAEEFWIGSYECSGDSLRTRLESFIVADDVIIEDQTALWSAIAVLGGGALQALPAEPGARFTFPGRRSSQPTQEYVFRTGSAVERDLRARLTSAREETPAFWENLRVRSLIPSVPRDAGPTDLPQEVGLVSAAVSFTKGCYLGQEIMARLKTRGRIRRQLRQVHFPAAALPVEAAARSLPCPLYAADRASGELRSFVADGSGGFIGLAMTPADAPPASSYSFSPGGEAVIELTVR